LDDGATEGLATPRESAAQEFSARWQMSSTCILSSHATNAAA
jgi:hypothetical protein